MTMCRCCSALRQVQSAAEPRQERGDSAVFENIAPPVMPFLHTQTVRTAHILRFMLRPYEVVPDAIMRRYATAVSTPFIPRSLPTLSACAVVRDVDLLFCLLLFVCLCFPASCFDVGFARCLSIYVFHVSHLCVFYCVSACVLSSQLVAVNCCHYLSR